MGNDGSHFTKDDVKGLAEEVRRFNKKRGNDKLNMWIIITGTGRNGSLLRSPIPEKFERGAIEIIERRGEFPIFSRGFTYFFVIDLEELKFLPRKKAFIQMGEKKKSIKEDTKVLKITEDDGVPYSFLIRTIDFERLNEMKIKRIAFMTKNLF